MVASASFANIYSPAINTCELLTTLDIAFAENIFLKVDYVSHSLRLDADVDDLPELGPQVVV